MNQNLRVEYIPHPHNSGVLIPVAMDGMNRIRQEIKVDYNQYPPRYATNNAPVPPAYMAQLEQRGQQQPMQPAYGNQGYQQQPMGNQGYQYQQQQPHYGQSNVDFMNGNRGYQQGQQQANTPLSINAPRQPQQAPAPEVKVETKIVEVSNEKPIINHPNKVLRGFDASVLYAYDLRSVLPLRVITDDKSSGTVFVNIPKETTFMHINDHVDPELVKSSQEIAEALGNISSTTDKELKQHRSRAIKPRVQIENKYLDENMALNPDMPDFKISLFGLLGNKDSSKPHSVVYRRTFDTFGLLPFQNKDSLSDEDKTRLELNIKDLTTKETPIKDKVRALTDIALNYDATGITKSQLSNTLETILMGVMVSNNDLWSWDDILTDFEELAAALNSKALWLSLENADIFTDLVSSEVLNEETGVSYFALTFRPKRAVGVYNQETDIRGCVLDMEHTGDLYHIAESLLRTNSDINSLDIYTVNQHISISILSPVKDDGKMLFVVTNVK